MGRRVKILVRKIKRVIRRAVKASSPSKSRNKKIPVFLLILPAIALLACAAIKFSVAPSGLLPGKAGQSGDEQPFYLFLKGDGFFASTGENPNEWLYSSDTLQFDEVWDTLVLNEESVYPALSKKEQAVWEETLLGELNLQEFPQTVAKEDALAIGSLCGFSTEETLLLLSGSQ